MLYIDLLLTLVYIPIGVIIISNKLFDY